MEKVLQLSHLSKAKNYASDFSRMGEDYIFTHLAPGTPSIDVFADPVRFTGMNIVLLLGGEIKGEINLEKFHLTPNSLMVLGGSSIVKITDVDWSKIEAYVLFVSTQFLHDINIDLNAINVKALTESVVPVTPLTVDETRLLERYLTLLHYNVIENAETVFSKSISRSLVSATLYQMMQFHYSRAPKESTEKPHSRRLGYVQDFMRLVHLHHSRERSVAFYADKLFISPKYLSLLIKEATGRSAAEWIDQFVILEAKNLLRFSNKNIQQVAYALNFSNQSSFGKYFKHLTGMSPTEYQKS